MKVVIIGENGSVHIQKWINAIGNYDGIKLHIITFNRGVKYDGINYHYLRSVFNNKLDFLLNISLVKKYVKEIKPDVLHAHYATSYGFLAACSGFHPLIITGWGADIFDSPRNPLMKRLLEYSFKKADAITVLSKITREEIKKLTDKHVYLIPFGVSLQLFTLRAVNTTSKIRIGTIRTLTEKYGLEYLIKAFAEVCKKYDNLQLDIVGDGPLKNTLVALVAELGIAKNVIFHGYINQNSDFEKYISLLQSFDIFAIPSVLDSETFGVAAVEASACGIPVIASSMGGLPEVITHEQTGIIVPPRNVESITLALERLITSSELRNLLGTNGRKKVEALYDWKANAQQMIDLYKSVCPNSK